MYEQLPNPLSQIWEHVGIAQRSKLVKWSFTGLTVLEFNLVCKEIKHNYEEHERRRLISRKKRILDVGAGRPFKLKVKERFVMLYHPCMTCKLEVTCEYIFALGLGRCGTS
ncbi:MAG: hypothetical protein WAJ93_10190 [Candidatus Nitrosopolaris sp.]